MLKILALLRPEDPDGCTWNRLIIFDKIAKELKLADVGYIDFNMDESELLKVFQAADVIYGRVSPAFGMISDILTRYNFKKPMVLDLDDWFKDISPFSDHYRNLGTSEVKLSDGSYLWKHGQSGFDVFENTNRVLAWEDACSSATAIITTTMYLRDKILPYNPNIVVIPNSMDLRRFPKVKAVNKDKNEVRLIWSGSSSHYEDLAEIKPALEILMTRYPQLHLYLSGVIFPGIIKNLPKDRVHTSGWHSAEAHSYYLACLDADISICPIKDNEFNKNKSSLKYYEMSALYVPTVARGINPYTDDIVDGKNGLLYNNNEEFIQKVSSLIDDPMLRVSIGNEAYEYVKTNRNVVDITKDWVDFLQGVANAYK